MWAFMWLPFCIVTSCNHDLDYYDLKKVKMLQLLWFLDFDKEIIFSGGANFLEAS